MARLTTRGRATAEAIAAHKPFKTSGAMWADTYGEIRPTGIRKSVGAWDSGHLSGWDLDKFREDIPTITYVVYSYSTPIAWVREDGHVHKVRQTFSVTTSKHQGNLYLLPGKRLRSDQSVHEIDTLKRLNLSVNGNPRFEVRFKDGRVATTSSDAGFCYGLENRENFGCEVIVDWTKAGRIANIKPNTEGI